MYFDCLRRNCEIFIVEIVFCFFCPEKCTMKQAKKTIAKNPEGKHIKVAYFFLRAPNTCNPPLEECFNKSITSLVQNWRGV